MEFSIRSTTKGWKVYVYRGQQRWIWLATFRHKAHMDLFLREVLNDPGRVHPPCVDGDVRDPSLAGPP